MGQRLIVRAFRSQAIGDPTAVRAEEIPCAPGWGGGTAPADASCRVTAYRAAARLHHHDQEAVRPGADRTALMVVVKDAAPDDRREPPRRSDLELRAS
ncbi:MAG: hypothetical protein QOJ29_4289 [Thermoleophilaceae bacterium]|nr:hypothetical protein [Thermoleophilaceae bacterium]